MSLRHTVLGILDWVPLHGYALRDLVRGYANIYPMTNASIYPTLRELEKDGLVRHEEEVRDGRLRKVYSITDAGRHELRRWLAEAGDQRGLYRDPVLLKISLLRDTALESAGGWLERELDRCRDSVEDTERFLKANGEQLPRYTRLTAEHGVELLRQRQQLLARVLDEIRLELGAEGPGAAGIPGR